MGPVIKAEGLKKYFGDVKAVDDISFQEIGRAHV